MTTPWMRGSDARRRDRDSTARAQLRVSDAERAEVTDRLAQHYGDGRLDQAELDDRLSRAMNAKTRGDLDALLADLPEAGPAAGPAVGPAGPRPARGAPVPARPAARRPRRRMLPVVLAVVLVMVAWRVLMHVSPLGWLIWPGAWFGLPWLWIALLVFCCVLWGRRR